MNWTLPDPARRVPPAFGLDAPSDAAFAARGAAILDYLYANFPRLRELSQHRPHFDPVRGRTTDPAEHTVELLACLDTGSLGPTDARIVRAAAIFHDVGKVLDPLNVRHGVHSTAIAPPYLADFALPPAAVYDVLIAIANHDTLGRLAQGKIEAREAAALFGSGRVLDLTARLTLADVRSIRGLQHVLPAIEAAFATVAALLAGREGSA